MSLWRFMFDNEVWQRMDIDELRSRTESMHRRMARSRMREAERIDQLERDVGELALLCRGLTQVLLARGGIDQPALQAALQQIDLEDGVADGRVTPEEERPKPPPKPGPFGPPPRPSRRPL